MKVLNIILSIFIFLFAAASAVCSYFLFEKRAQFVKGHEKMAKAIYETSKALDQNSGTDYAKDLTTEVLAHEKYADLDSKLPKISTQGKNIISQRDFMADSLAKIDNALSSDLKRGMSGSDVSSFMMIDKYDSSTAAVGRKLNSVLSRRNDAYAEIARIAKGRGGVNVVDLKEKDNNARNALRPFSDFISKTVDNSNSYRNALSEIARIAGARVSVSDSSRDTGIKNVKAAVSKKIGEVNSLAKELAKAKREIAGLNRSVKAKESQRLAAVKAKAETAEKLAALRKSIGVSEEFVAWKPGSEAALSRLCGKIIGVSKEYGYFVIDLGEKSVVYQKDAKTGESVKICLNLASGIELMIVRPSSDVNPATWYNADGAVLNSTELAAKDEYIASSKIVKVGEKESVVDLPAGADVKVGDIVLYKAEAR
ncbi:MAG: hypothetical protein E7054_01965 [Lentisphaerae bacterium]|nr:hypothetical protein [Lentisphaerota bacterium]